MRLLEIDLTSESFKIKEIEKEYLTKFLGGRGLGVRLFIDYASPEINPIDAPVFFLTGPMTLSKAPLSGRFHALFKSPLTNTIFDSSCGGKAGYYLKTQSIDVIALLGRSENEKIIHLKDGKVSLLDSSLRGLKISEKEDTLQKRFGSNISTIIVGPAAERGLLYANVCSDKRFFGRGGLGYLLATKNVSAIVIERSLRNVEPYDKARFDFVVNEVRKWIHGNPITSQGLPEFGTSLLMNLLNELKILPHKNFSESYFSKADNISGEALKKQVKSKRACLSCPVACGRVTEIGEGPEFETLWALGANLSIDNLKFIMEINKLCAEHGVDTISFGGSISAYLEANNIPFGDEKIIEDLVEKTLNCKAEGALIAKGSLRLSKELKKPEVSMTVKGLELPAYHPLGLSGMALAFGTSNRGGCHLRAYMLAVEVLGIPKLLDRRIKRGKAGLVIYLQNAHAAADSAIFCRFLSLAVTDDYLARLISAYTGMDLKTQDFLKIGERIYNLERYINVQNGFDRKDDLLPARLDFEGYEDMLNEYYRGRGWGEEGKDLNLSKILE